MSDPVVLLSTGDVVGPAGGVTNNSMVLFDGTSGKLIKGNNAVVTAAGLAILDDVSAAAQKVTLGLGNVDNTSDINKPISTATQTALDLKATIASPTFTGVPSAPTAAVGTATTQLATTAFVAAAEKLNAPIATVAAAANINLTTGAPNTSQLAISGTGVSINGFTVAADRFFVVKMTGASNELVNGAALVTGRGTNIPVVAGDTFLMRSTAANTVEIVCGSFLIDRAIGSGQTYQLFTSPARITGAVYTNSTGRTIHLLFTAMDSTGAAFLEVNGVQVAISAIPVTSGNEAPLLSAPIPAGATYKVIGTTYLWAELR